MSSEDGAMEERIVRDCTRLLLHGSEGFVQHQLRSFSAFCDKLPALFEDTEEIVADVEGRTATVRFDGATLMQKSGPRSPLEARLLGETYAAQLSVQMTLTMQGKENTEQRINMIVGEIPIMVGCSLVASSSSTHGGLAGYFIVNGVRKVLMPVETSNVRRVQVFQPDGKMKAGVGRIKAFVATASKGMFPERTVHKLEITDKALVIYISRRVPQVPLIPLLRALGVDTDLKILELLTLGDVHDSTLVEFFAPFLEHAKELVQGIDMASNLFYIGSELLRKREDFPEAVAAASEMLDRELFSDMAVDDKKVYLLGYMAHSLCLAHLGRGKNDGSYLTKRLGSLSVSGRNSLHKTRLECAGEMYLNMMRHSMVRFRNETTKKLVMGLKSGKFSRPDLLFDLTIISKDLRQAFASGDWFDNRNTLMKGVSTGETGESTLAALCTLRNVKTPTLFAKNAGQSHLLHESHFGRYCPVDTPEQEDCGLVKSLALFSYVSVDRRDLDDGILDAAGNMLEQNLDGMGRSCVFLNGLLIGFTRNAQGLVTQLRNSRREGNIHREVEIARRGDEVHISSDAGRILRPLLIVGDNSELLIATRLVHISSVDQLYDSGVLELIGPEEEAHCLIASSVHDLQENIYTHMEVFPSAFLSLACNSIPFANHNHSNRVMFQARKHVTRALKQQYPQKPLVTTFPMEALQKWEMFNGQNCVVAVANFEGYNQEDSIILNQSSIDRGLFRSIISKERRDVTRKGMQEEYCKPEFDKQGRRLSTEEIEADGFPAVPSPTAPQRLIIAKVQKQQPLKKRLKDGSLKNGGDRSQEDGAASSNAIRLGHLSEGHVTSVIRCSNEQGESLARVRTTQVIQPQVGDKMSSFHGQKGVVGRLARQEDMPFSRQGVVPDVIINPHAFPSRFTTGQLLEAIMGKLLASDSGNKAGADQRRCRMQEGLRKAMKLCATPFLQGEKRHQLVTEMMKMTMEEVGKEQLFLGESGVEQRCKVFMGINFYQQLPQRALSSIKWSGRNGRPNLLTRQPLKKKNALKFGEMERDCLLAHGAAAELQQRLFELSDPYSVFICTSCGRDAGVQLPAKCRFCAATSSSSSFKRVRLPYALHLLFQELNSMGIDVRLTQLTPC